MTEANSVDQVQEYDLKDFFPITPSNLSSCSTVGFDIYLREKNDRFVLYHEKSNTLAPSFIKKINDHLQLTLYILKDQRTQYMSFISGSIGSILTDESIDADAKAAMVYDSATELMGGIFEDPYAEVSISSAKSFVKQTLDYFIHTPEAFSKLMNLTSHDYYTYTHSVNVYLYGTFLARQLDFVSPEDLEMFATGFLLHDIGKSQIDLAILNKEGKLNEDEWAIMKQHPTVGAKILAETHKFPRDMLVAVEQHHEKMDGSGYPHGLTSGDIHPFSKICLIADVFDALTTKRSYKPAINTFQALQIMKDEMANHMDYEFFKIFLHLLQS